MSSKKIAKYTLLIRDSDTINTYFQLFEALQRTLYITSLEVQKYIQEFMLIYSQFTYNQLDLMKIAFNYKFTI